MSEKRTRRAALTLTDLIFAASALLVVTLVVGPALTKPRATARLTDCLSNLQRIGLALHAYAAEDPREQAIPIIQQMVKDVSKMGLPTIDQGKNLYRTANWFAWGGQSATRVFKTVASGGYALSDTPPQDANSIQVYAQRADYAASCRPLNGYIAPDPLDVFHCPADTGYPDDPRNDDSPIANALRPCWDTLGNSYRANLRNIWSGGLPPSVGSFSFGPLGHRRSTLPSQSTSVLVADPLWSYELSKLIASQDEPNVIPVGWHGTPWADNVLYADGSARLTSVQGARQDLVRRPLGADSLALVANTPPVCPLGPLGPLCAGPSWQVDCYPTPGAVIWGDWSEYIEYYNNCWPFKNAYPSSLARAPGDDPARVPPGDAAGESVPSALTFVP